MVCGWRRLRRGIVAGEGRMEWDSTAAEWYAEHHGGRATNRMAVETLYLAEDAVVLDLGCGTGEAIRHLAPVVGRVIGVDREPAMLKVAQARTRELGNVVLRPGELDALPLEDGEVDVVLLMLVLHHVPDLRSVFSEIARSLRPGGRMVLLDMVAHDRLDWRHTMGHLHLGFSRKELSELAGEAGLKLSSYRALRPDPEASGPPLFVGVFRTC